MIRIAIVEDKLSNRRIISDKLNRNQSFRIVLEASDGEIFLGGMKNFPEEERPQIVLMDLEMPVIDGVSAIASASALYPEVKFVVLTIFDDDDKIFRAIRAGACGYLLKEESGETIADMLVTLIESGPDPYLPALHIKYCRWCNSRLQLKMKKSKKKIFSNCPKEKKRYCNY